MVESAALLVDEALPQRPMRQWVLSVPFPLRFLFASQPKIMGKALGIVCRSTATHLTHNAGYKKSTAHTGAVTLIQRFGNALNLNIHLLCMDARMPWAHGCAGTAHMLFLDGVYVGDAGLSARFGWVKAPTSAELTQLIQTIAPGPHQGRKVFTLQTLPDERDADNAPATGTVAGLLRASCPTPFGPACGCSKSLPAILSSCTLVSRPKPLSVTR